MVQISNQMRKKLIIANWKENKTNDEAAGFILKLKEKIRHDTVTDIVICPSFVSIITSKDCSRDSEIKIGAQNISQHDKGAYTGEVSARMIKDFCEYAIIGHSERRILYNESDKMINRKLIIALKNGIIPILCVGEDLTARNSCQTEQIVLGQLAEDLKDVCPEDIENIVIAYEPVWAISKGDPSHVPATPEDAESVHILIRSFLSRNYGDSTASKVRIVYGGSVKKNNVKGFLGKEDIDGALVGSASLDIDSFVELINS